MAPRTENLAEWSAHLLARLRREAAVTGDPSSEALQRRRSTAIRAWLPTAPRPGAPGR